MGGVLWGLTLAWCCALGRGELSGQEVPASRLPRLNCSGASDVQSIRAAQALLNSFLSRTGPPREIDTRHAVLLVPSAPLLDARGFAGEVYAALPRTVLGPNFTTTFTKFVVVGHASGNPTNLLDGFSIGDDVCEGSNGLVDSNAVLFLHKRVLEHLASFAPKWVNCKQQPGGACRQAISQGLAAQLPFIGALLGEGRTMAGRLLPIMMQRQDVVAATRMGDMLSLMVQEGGIWEAERVLFIFTGDLSQGLSPPEAVACDQRTAELLAKGGVPQVAEYFDAMRAGDFKDGCRGALPIGFGPLLAGVRVASQLHLVQRRGLVAHDGLPSDGGGQPEDAQVRGYGAFLFWADTRTVWARLGARRGRPAALLAAGPGRFLPGTSVQRVV